MNANPPPPPPPPPPQPQTCASPSPSLPRTLPPPPVYTHAAAETVTIVMCRHGESEWNALNQFCGWFDAALSEAGKKEAAAGGAALKVRVRTLAARLVFCIPRLRSIHLLAENSPSPRPSPPLYLFHCLFANMKCCVRSVHPVCVSDDA